MMITMLSTLFSSLEPTFEMRLISNLGSRPKHQCLRLLQAVCSETDTFCTDMEDAFEK